MSEGGDKVDGSVPLLVDLRDKARCKDICGCYTSCLRWHKGRTSRQDTLLRDRNIDSRRTYLMFYRRRGGSMAVALDGVDAVVEGVGSLVECVEWLGLPVRFLFESSRRQWR